MRSVQLENRLGREYSFWNSVTADELTVLESMPLRGQIHTSSGGLLPAHQYVRLGDRPGIENGGRDITFIVDQEFINKVRAEGNATMDVDKYSFRMQLSKSP